MFMAKYEIPPYIIHDVGSAQALAESYSWGMTDLKVPNVWKKTKGKDIRVAVLDSGCSIHPDLKANIDYKLSKSFIPNEDIYDNYVGHSTHVAGIIGAELNEAGIVGVAPEVTIITVKVLGKNGGSVGNSVEQGLDYCIQLKPDIVNMSLGGAEPMVSLHEKIKKLFDMGIIVVCAAGNNGEEKVLYPAQYDETIAVGSYSPATIRSRSLFSSYGDTLDIMAPGEEILSTWLNAQYSVLSGTSMAAPFVSGVLALMLSYYKAQGKKLTIDEMKNKLLTNCIDIGATGKDKFTGWGVINPEKVFLPATNNTPIVPKKTFWQKFKSWFSK
jgi:major intracellular serine protease